MLDAIIGGAPIPFAKVDLPVMNEGPAGWKERAQYLALRGLVGGWGFLPAGTSRGFARGLAKLLPGIDPRHALGAADFIGTAFPAYSETEVRQLVQQAYGHLVDVSLRADHLRRKMIGHPVGDFFDLEFCDEARELFEARGHGKGVIGLSAHLGWWEITAHVLNPLGLGPACAIMKPPKNAFLTRYIVRSRAQMGGGLCLPRHGAMSALPTLLRAGATLQLLVDQRAHRRFVEAPFFGRMASCDRTLGVLARRVPKPILVYACLGTEDPERFRFVAPKVIDPEELSGLSALEITTRVNLEIESLIRMAPEQYLWLHDRFRDRPASAPSPQSALS